ncbi:MAG TPA: tetratricopeptide repeat protein [Methylomirabilota bacterium]|nr:tetratricopeptide repeat protein [Methylomirabilota bacterium]
MRGALTLLIAMALIAGCATTIEKGESALRQGRYVDAERYFNEALTEDPSRVSALVGLGVTQYKRGGLDQAIETLQKSLPARPNEPTARLYLGLSYLMKNDAARAAEQLAALRALPLDPRLAQQIDHALEVLRGPPLTEPVRELLASSLDTAAELAREAEEARAMYYPYPYVGYPFFPGYPYLGYPYPGFGYPPCVLVRRAGQLVCI